jgi:hypothetical protein
MGLFEKETYYPDVLKGELFLYVLWKFSSSYFKAAWCGCQQ